MLTTTTNMRKNILLLPIVAGLLLSPVLAYANVVDITPVLIDLKGKPRDIFKETITLTNNTDHKMELYPSVNNVLPVDGQQQFTTAHDVAEQSGSLANWIELSRGVIELAPGEKRVINFIVRIDLRANPGLYHAAISFAEGWTRPDAKTNPPAGPVTINLEVESDVREVMQLNKFTSDNMVFTGDDVLFNYQLQNIGNQELQPTGEIRIYDRKGTEVAAVDVNREGKNVSPDQTAQLASVWSAAKGFGKFKALLTVNYGKGQTAAVQDTVYFWIIPWKQLLMLFSGVLAAVVILMVYFHRWFEERHIGKLAHAGLLKFEEMAHIHPHAHPAELHAAVEEAVSKKRNSMFSFRRSANTSDSAPHASSAATMQNTIPQPPSLREAFPKEAVASHASTGGTIDLKQLHIARRGMDASPASSIAPETHTSNPVPHVEVQGSVINLKRRQ